MKIKILILLFGVLNGTLHSQILLPETKTKLPKEVHETSGIEWMNDSIWVTHNDSGDDPVLYFLNKKGELKKHLKLKSCTNVDWEDIAYDGKGNLYIADLGNNLNNRKNLKIYQYNFLDSTIKNYSVHYSDQKFPTKESQKNFDCEGIAWMNEKIFLFTKNYTNPYNGICKYYALSLEDSTTHFSPIDSLSLGTESFFKNSVTSSDFSDERKTMGILTYRYLHLFYDFPSDSIFRGKHVKFHLPEIQQREAICFDSIGNLWMTDEKSQLKNGGYLYYYDLQKFYTGETFYRNPEIGIVSVTLDQNYIDIYGIGNCQFKLMAEITVDGRYTIEIMKNGKLFKTYWNDWKVSDKKIELVYYLGETISKENNYAIRIYRDENLVYQNKIKL